jgi:large subunit ribosomal protein L29
MSKRIDFVKSVKGLNPSDLQSRIQEDELRLKKLEFAHAISPLENPMSIRALRKDIARLKTFLGEKKAASDKLQASSDKLQAAS